MSRRHSHKGSATSSPPSSPKRSPLSPTALKLKSKDVHEPLLPDLWLGRPGHSLKMGIVGMPNVGKSMLFNALTDSTEPSENYPFTTTDASEARAKVPDARFDQLCDIYMPQLRTPAFLSVVDIAGLIEGSSIGKGLGNQFLSHIHACDGLFHVVRAFDLDCEEVVHVDDDVDPVRDLDTVTKELIAKDLEHVMKEKEKVMKHKMKSTKGAAAAEVSHHLDVVEKCVAALEGGTQVRFLEWHSMEIDYLNSLFLLTAKPSVFLINLSEKDFLRKKNKFLLKIKTWVDENCPGEPIIPFSAAYEANIDRDNTTTESSKDQAASATTATITAIPKIIESGFTSLHLIRFFTKEGTKEVKAWSVRQNTPAIEAAGHVHSDFKAGFICCDVIHFDDLAEFGTEAAVKEAGKAHQEGKAYVVQDGDILHFKIGQMRGGRGKSH